MSRRGNAPARYTKYSCEQKFIGGGVCGQKPTIWVERHMMWLCLGKKGHWKTGGPRPVKRPEN